MLCIVYYNKKSFNNYQLESNTKFLKIKNEDASSPYLSSEFPLCLGHLLLWEGVQPCAEEQWPGWRFFI